MFFCLYNETDLGLLMPVLCAGCAAAVGGGGGGAPATA